jgi:plastocyanin
MFFTAASIVSTFALGAMAAVHDVDVGKDGLAFSPEAIFADVGDQVVFHFHPKNHTVTQSSFADPCSPAPGGFDSGFQFVAANSTDAPPTHTITVQDKKPIWVFCNQAANTPNSHCGAGMIFSVNCPADPAPNSFDNFKKKALAIGAQLKAAAATSSSADSGYGSSAAGSYGSSSAAGSYGSSSAADSYGSSSAADSQSSAAAGSGSWSGYGDSYVTTAYGDATVTLPPPASVATVTATVSATVDGSAKVWTSTYASFPNSPNPTPNAEPKVFQVSVGAGGLKFDPERVTAQPGDIVQFSFVAGNHTVTQSSFAAPCNKAINNETNLAQWDSGFQFVGTSTTPLVVNMTVNSTAPTWFYCRQAAQTANAHCGKGMVFAVNSDESGPRNLSAFQNLAEKINGTAVADTAAANTPASGASSVGVSSSILLGAVTLAFAALL